MREWCQRYWNLRLRRSPEDGKKKRERRRKRKRELISVEIYAWLNFPRELCISECAPWRERRRSYSLTFDYFCAVMNETSGIRASLLAVVTLFKTADVRYILFDALVSEVESASSRARDASRCMRSRRWERTRAFCRLASPVPLAGGDEG